MFWNRMWNRHSGPSSPHTVARREMVERQLRARGITDAEVLAVMARLPRELFVPSKSASAAYENTPLAIDCGQTISQPYMVALMSQELRLSGRERVLEIGTGSGYQTAILAALAGHVFSVERHADLSQQAARRLRELSLHNVTLTVGDGTCGLAEHAPYDRILVTAGGPRVPQPLRDQLAVGGRLLAPIGDTDCQTLTAVDRLTADEYRSTPICSCVFVQLIGEHGWSTH